MVTTTDLLQSIQSRDFSSAKQQFGELVQDRMRQVLNREYRSAAESFLNLPQQPKQ